jgi:hypothetical protein
VNVPDFGQEYRDDPAPSHWLAVYGAGVPCGLPSRNNSSTIQMGHPTHELSMWSVPADGLIDVTRSRKQAHDLVTRVNNKAGTSATTLRLRHRDELAGWIDLNSGNRTNLGS